MIIDTTLLIFYAKINHLHLLNAVYKTVIIPEQVYAEAVTQAIEFPDSILIRGFIQQKKIHIKVLSPDAHDLVTHLTKTYSNLNKGEAQAIALALQEKETEVLLDDNVARTIAKKYGLVPHGSLHILLLAYQKKVITREQVFFLLRELIEAGLWISARVLDRFYELFRQLEKKR